MISVDSAAARTCAQKIAAFAEVSSHNNLRNVLKAHSIGRQVARQGDYAYEAVKAYMNPPSRLQSFADDAVNFARRTMDSGIKIFTSGGSGLVLS